MCPANASAPITPPADGEDDKQLCLADLPRLQALIQGPDGAEIMRELHRLVNREPRRAPRFQRNMFARIRVGAEEAPEVAVVRNISRSGVRLRLSSSAHLDVLRARTISIEMRLPGAPFVNCEATLVRVVEHLESGVELAFSFSPASQADPSFVQMLDRLASTASNER